jgi:hypothetical protein
MGCNRVAEIISLDSLALRARVRSVVVARVPELSKSALPPFCSTQGEMIMKSARFSAGIVFAALLCFAPYALGQGRIEVKRSSASISSTGGHGEVLRYDFEVARRNDDGRGNQGGDGWGGGWGGGGNGGGGGWGNGGGGNGGGGGVPVPEGGTDLVYLSLAGLCCAGAMAFRARRASVSANL